MIEAAILAPSWKNSQVSRYYICDEPDKTKEFLKCMPEFNQKSMQNAPAVIVSTVVKNRSGFERDGSYTTHLKVAGSILIMVFRFRICALKHMSQVSAL